MSGKTGRDAGAGGSTRATPLTGVLRLDHARAQRVGLHALGGEESACNSHRGDHVVRDEPPDARAHGAGRHVAELREPALQTAPDLHVALGVVVHNVAVGGHLDRRRWGWRDTARKKQEGEKRAENCVVFLRACLLVRETHKRELEGRRLQGERKGGVLLGLVAATAK